MTTITETKTGTFCWIDLMTGDVGGAKNFYGELFGWSFEDVPTPEGGTYTMCGMNGGTVCGLSKTPPEHEAQGVPPHWNSYIAVDDADAASEKAKDLGGNILAPPFDVMEVGRMSVIQDPTGAAVCLWQSKNDEGQWIANEPGSLVWNELMTRNASAAIDFYTALCGWDSEKFDGPMEYYQLKNGERPQGGVLPMGDQFPAEVPANWLVYFAVEDCDASAEKAKSLGGTVQMGPQDIPEVGRFSVIIDPTGAAFAIINLVSPPA